MGAVVVSGATCTCTNGTAPCTLRASNMTISSDGMPMATIADCQPGTNLLSPGFGMCVSLANPAVAAATAAAMGVLTPQPCTLAPAGPWIGSGTGTLINGTPVLTNDASLTCALGMGQIKIVSPGQTKTIVQ